ncbi:baseplate J/gp47 family protein [Moorena producens]|uniref:baseplate J/gp47 family protein n=1 Tax=Moorena producens TaxID=1155739 RepID=UPI003C788C10
MQAPKIDQRSYKDIVAYTEACAKAFTDWRPLADNKPDGGRSLIRIFGHLATIVGDRLNQVPDKNFLAFLDLIGTSIGPPRPARVPLTFYLATGSTEALVPAQTEVAAPPTEGEEEEVIFETERDLVLTNVQLQAVFVREPEQDRYSDRTKPGTGQEDTAFLTFAGDQPIEHSLYVACDDLLTLPESKTLTLTIDSPNAVGLAAVPITWSYWNGEVWKPILGIIEGLEVEIGSGEVIVQPGKAIDYQGREINLAQKQSVDVSGNTNQTRLVVISYSDSEPVLELIAETDTSKPANTHIRLAYLYIDDQNQISKSFPSLTNSGNSEWEVSIENLPLPSHSSINGINAAWLKAQLTNTPLPPPQLLPQINRISASVEIHGSDIAPELCFFDTDELDLSKDFYPFGEEPGFNDTFYLASQEVFSKPGAEVTVNLVLSTDAPAVNTTGGVEVRWEVWNGSTWQVVKHNSSGLSAANFTIGGAFTFTLPDQMEPQPVNGESNYWLRARIITGNYGTEEATAEETSTTLQPSRAASTTLTQAVNSGANTVQVSSASGFQDNDSILIGADTSQPEYAQISSISSNTLTLTNTIYSDHASGATVELFEQEVSSGINTIKVDSIRGFLPSDRIRIDPGTNKQEDLEIASIDFNENTLTLTSNLTQSHPVETSVVLLPASALAPPVVKSLKLSYSYNSGDSPLSACLTYNDFTYIDCTTQANQDGSPFEAFTPTQDLRPTLYLGFDAPFANRSTTIYAQVEPPAPGELATSPTITQPAVIAAEYSSPEYPSLDRWVRLGVEADETAAMSQPGLVRFIGPTDLTKQSEFGKDLYWLRIRWQGGDFRVPPRLRQLLLNTTWATQATTIENEILGSSNGNPDQTFSTLQFPVLEGQQLEVREEEETDLQEEVWVVWQEVSDFYGSGAEDRHYVLNHLTGEVSFGNNQQGRIPALGSNNIRMVYYRTGGGKQGNKPAETITELKTTVPYVDSVTNLEAASGGSNQESLEWVKEQGPKTLRHRYKAVTAEDIEDLVYQASTDVARAWAITPKFNPKDLQWLPNYYLPLEQSGTITVSLWSQGNDPPTTYQLQVKINGPGQTIAYEEKIFTSDQAGDRELSYPVTPSQFSLGTEWYVTMVNLGDVNVSGDVTIEYPDGSLTGNFNLPPKTTSDHADNSPYLDRDDVGQVELIILPDSSARQPTPSLGLLDLVEEYILARCAPTLDLRVTGPYWVEVTVTAEVVPLSLDLAEAVVMEVNDALNHFLHPLTGGVEGQGWPFGRQPHKSDLYRLIESVPGVNYVKSLSIDLAEIPEEQSNRFLIYSGEHQISLGQDF